MSYQNNYIHVTRVIPTTHVSRTHTHNPAVDGHQNNHMYTNQSDINHVFHEHTYITSRWPQEQQLHVTRVIPFDMCFMNIHTHTHTHRYLSLTCKYTFDPTGNSNV